MDMDHCLGRPVNMCRNCGLRLQAPVGNCYRNEVEKYCDRPCTMSSLGYAKYYCRLELNGGCAKEIKKNPNKCMTCIMDDPKMLTKASEFCILNWVKWICKVHPGDHSFDHYEKDFGKHDSLYQGKTAKVDQPKNVPIPTIAKMVASMELPNCELDDSGGIPDAVKTAMRKLHRFH